jgi:SH3-like domain-containing protein
MQTHTYLSRSTEQQVERKLYSIVFSFVILACLTFSSFAQQDVNVLDESAPPKDPNAITPLPVPYIAEITGNDVNIRSGPGTNYYRCGKLNKDDKVEVLSAQLGWSRIVPPPGSFSWISMQ